MSTAWKKLGPDEVRALAKGLSVPQLIILRLIRKGEYYLKGVRGGRDRAARKNCLATLIERHLVAAQPSNPAVPHVLTITGVVVLEAYEAAHGKANADAAVGMVE